ncbi:MAG: RagB/SusD family nutrient uptake outer membrane protein [Chitinophagaceae bacterium]
MYQKYKILFLGLVTAGVMLQYSCKKYINAGPIDQTYDANFWTNQNSVEEAVAGAYVNLRTAIENGANYFVFGDLTSDEITTTAWNLATVIPGSNKDYNYVPYYEHSLKNWSDFYVTINQCNLILARATQMPLSDFGGDSTVRNSYLGEAYFIRAFSYFYMVRAWSDPVVYNQLLTNPSSVPLLKRSPDSTVLRLCIGDVQSAINYLSWTTPDNAGPVRAGKGAALALLAHIYAWQKDYTDAAAACDQIIQSGNYSLETAPNYLNIWAGGDPESIFELNMLFTQNVSETSGSFFGKFLEPPYVNTNARSSAYYTVNNDQDFYDLYGGYNTTNDADTALDIRFQQCFGMSNNNNLLLLKYNNVKYTNPAQPSQGFYCNNNLVIFRLADIILLDAEANAYLGNSAKAISLVNQIRERANVPDYDPSDGDLYKFVIDERARELFGEGWHYYDLIRSGFLSQEIPQISPSRIAQQGYAWPLDLSSLKPADPLLNQTTWWAIHP